MKTIGFIWLFAGISAAIGIIAAEIDGRALGPTLWFGQAVYFVGIFIGYRASGWLP